MAINSRSSYKLRRLGDVSSTVAAAPTVTEAAKRLGVSRVTVYRWIVAGRVPKPGGEVSMVQVGPKVGQSPKRWAMQVRATRAFDATASALLDLAVSAFILARDNPSPLVRLAAMTRFQALVKQLRLDGAEAEPVHGKVEPAVPATTKSPAIRRVTHDPRKLLMAVK